MADPARIQLLALILSDPAWDVTVQRLAGPPGMDPESIREHLAAMSDVQLLDRHTAPDGAEIYSPSHDALVRFGALVLDLDATVTERPRSEHERLLSRVVETLAEDFRGVFGAETVERYVFDSYDLLAARAKVRTYLPVLTARFAADRLGALSRAEGRTVRDGTDVLFVCVHNAGRSQIAAAVLRHLAPGTGAGPHRRLRPGSSHQRR